MTVPTYLGPPRWDVHTLLSDLNAMLECRLMSHRAVGGPEPDMAHCSTMQFKLWTERHSTSCAQNHCIVDDHAVVAVLATSRLIRDCCINFKLTSGAVAQSAVRRLGSWLDITVPPSAGSGYPSEN